jgi:TolB-like protein
MPQRMTGVIEPKVIEEELARVLASRAFARATRGRELLRYLINAHLDQQTRRLKETTIALDVFNRDPATFDGDQDGIVRVSINRVREHLERYYADDGRDASLRFEIPRGIYVPIIRRTAPRGLPERPRIAVLPLTNLTGNAHHDVLSDGLTEDLIDALAQIPQLRVTARTSSFRYKGVATEVRKIGRDLDVDALLEGSVQLVEDRVRVTAQMVMTSDGMHLWGHAFEEAIDDRHLLQSSLRELVVRSIAEVSLPLPITQNRGAEAQVRYLVDQARMLNMTQLPENMERAEKLATDATSLTPDFVDAWFVLAMVRYTRYALWMGTDALSLEEVTTPLNRALQLQPDYPQAVSLSAYVAILSHWDWNTSLSLASRARALAPSHAGILGRLGAVHAARSEFDLAIDTYRECVALDPYAPPAYTGLALALMYSNRIAEAKAVVANAVSKCGDSLYLRDSLIATSLYAGEFEHAVQAAHDVLRSSPQAWQFKIRLAQALSALGRRDEAEAALNDALRVAPSRNASLLRASVSATSTDSDRFFADAHAALADRSPQCMWLLADALTRAHSHDPRWLSLCSITCYEQIR